MKKDLLYVVFIVGLVLMFAIIGTVLIMVIMGKPIPDILVRWSETTLGFIIATLSMLAKGWSDDDKT